MSNTYDFYKPKLDSEYPEVDGPVSVVTYTKALDYAYSAFRNKINKNESTPFSLESVDYALFHSPYGKQAVKGHARMLYNDFLANPDAPKFANVVDKDRLKGLAQDASLKDKDLEKAFITLGKAEFKAKVDPAMECSKRLGNMYTGSLYGCFASLLSTVDPTTLKDKRVSMFAFGSGCAASVFAFRVKGDVSEIQKKLDLLNRLKNMKVVPCEEFIEALNVSLYLVVLSHRPNITFYLIIFFHYSSVKRTTCVQITLLRARWMPSGQALTTSTASTASTAASM